MPYFLRLPTANLMLCIGVLLTGIAHATDFHVSTLGRDGNSGTASSPFASLQAAQAAARKAPRGKPVTVHVAPGIYYLPSTLVFTDADSGSSNAPVVYQADPGGEVILSGGSRLQLDWKPFRSGIFQAKVPPSMDMDQLWINGQRQWMARFPNRETGPDLNVFDTWKLEPGEAPDPARDPLKPTRVALWSNPVGGYLHALHPALWGGVHWRIVGKKSDGTLALEGGTQNNRGSGVHPRYRMVENIFEELDAPGEWFCDSSAGAIYYYPRPGMDLRTARVETVRLRHLIELRGNPAKPVRFLTFRGFTFRHTRRTFMETKEPLLRSDWTTYRGGAVFLTGTENCGLIDSYFDQVGGNSVFVSGYNRRVTFRGCRIENSGANGIAFVGEARAVRSPLFQYDTAFDYSKLDRTPGPLTDDYPSDCMVEDCLITRTGRIEKQTAGIEIAMARDITVRHCSIYDVPRAGINVGDGCWGGHLIEFCDIFDTVKETGDHGCWNSWGRDRYWHPDPAVIEREVAADPTLPSLDTVRPTILRNNRWRCDHGWDVDLDDGSSRYRIYYNLFLNGGLKLREGYDRRVWNNITVNNSLHPHVWLKSNADLVTKNIWMGAYQPAVMPGAHAKWGRFVDFNFFASSKEDQQKFLNHDCDANSLVGDPGFIDPSHGDFRVSDDSPARRVGFRNFPMDQFGVQSPRLRKLARTPSIPELRRPITPSVADPAPSEDFEWLGATLHPLSGQEYSAYGIGSGDGGIALVQVPAGSQAAQIGLQTGDLILSIHGVPTLSVGDVVNVLGDLRQGTEATAEVIVVRKQARIPLRLPKPAALPLGIK